MAPSRSRRALVAFALAGAAAGCVSEVERYPETWASVAAEGSCRAVAGMYREDAERGPAPNSTVGYPRLSWLLTLQEYFGRSGSPVTLSFPEPDVFLVAKVEERRYRLGGDEAACVTGGVELRRSWRSPTYVGPGDKRVTVTVTRGRDGTLVVSHEMQELGWLFSVVPTFGRSVEWYRFQPAPPG